MKQAEIIRWLQYWKNAKMVAVDEISAFDQVHLARKYCSCMRVGVFSPDLVSDLQIWRALSVMRGTHPEWCESVRDAVDGMAPGATSRQGLAETLARGEA